MNNQLVTRFSNHPDIHQTPEYATVMHKINWRVAGEPGTQIFYRALGPLSISKMQRPKKVDLDWLAHFRRAHHTLTTHIEPSLSLIYDHGYRVEPFAHSASSLINIKLSEQDLLKSFRQKTRYNITHNLAKNEVKIISTPVTKLSKDQTSDFFSLHAEWGRRKHVIGYTQSLLQAVLQSFDSKSTLHLAYDKNKTPLGALLSLSHGEVSTYYATFCNVYGHSLFVPTLLTYRALLTAKANGSTIFDFGGIYDSRYPRMYKNWQGFTKFKQGFNPTPISYRSTRLQLFW